MSICAPVVSVMRRIVLPPGPMSRPIFSGSIWIVWIRGAYCAEVLARSGQGGEHLAQDLDPGVAGLQDGLFGDLDRQAVDLEIELEARDALGRARELEIHVAEMVFLAEDVGDGDPAGDGAGRVVLGDEAAGNARDGRDDRHAGIHQRQAAATDRGHGGRAVGGHDFRSHADGVGEHILGRNHREQRALGQRAVADFAAARPAGSAGFTGRERREVVVENEALGLGAAGEGVEFLGLLGGPERREDEALRVAALEERGAVHPREHADFARDRTERRGVAIVGADALVEDGLPVCLVLQILENDRDVVFLEFAFAELGEQRRFGFLLQGVDIGLADLLLLAEDGVGHLRTGDTFNDGARLGLRCDEVELGLGLARDGDEFPDRRDDRLDRLMGEFQRLDEAGLGQLIGGAFDHQHVLLVADVDQIEVRLEHLLDRRVGDELAVDLADAERGDRAVPRNVGERERRRRAVDHGDVGFMRLVGGEEDAEDLHLVEKTGREQRTARAIAQARRQDLLLGGTAFALEEAGGKAAGGGVFLPVIDGEREDSPGRASWSRRPWRRQRRWFHRR